MLPTLLNTQLDYSGSLCENEVPTQGEMEHGQEGLARMEVTA